jgi:hypothetical protein
MEDLGRLFFCCGQEIAWNGSVVVNLDSESRAGIGRWLRPGASAQQQQAAELPTQRPPPLILARA